MFFLKENSTVPEYDISLEEGILLGADIVHTISVAMQETYIDDFRTASLSESTDSEGSGEAKGGLVKRTIQRIKDAIKTVTGKIKKMFAAIVDFFKRLLGKGGNGGNDEEQVVEGALIPVLASAAPISTLVEYLRTAYSRAVKLEGHGPQSELREEISKASEKYHGEYQVLSDKAAKIIHDGREAKKYTAMDKTAMEKARKSIETLCNNTASVLKSLEDGVSDLEKQVDHLEAQKDRRADNLYSRMVTMKGLFNEFTYISVRFSVIMSMIGQTVIKKFTKKEKS